MMNTDHMPDLLKKQLLPHHSLARLAAFSYFDDQMILKRSFGRYMAFDHMLDIGDTQVVLGSYKDQKIAVFRGVEIDRVNDIRAALDYGPRLERYGQVHNGFVEALDLVWDDLLKWTDPQKDLVFVGHSMGGALAQIAAARYLADYEVFPEVVVFGAPRIGQTLNLHHDLHPYRYSLVGDPIPFLPMNWMGPYREKSRRGFRLVFPDGRIKKDPPHMLHRVLTWRSLLARPTRAPKLAWERHSAMAYAQALAQNMKQTVK